MSNPKFQKNPEGYLRVGVSVPIGEAGRNPEHFAEQFAVNLAAKIIFLSDQLTPSTAGYK